MKLTEQSVQVLAYRTAPNGWVGAIGALLIGVGFLVGSVPGKLMTLDCERSGPHQGTCVMTETYLLKRVTVVRLPLVLMRRAFVEPVRWGTSTVTSKMGVDLSDGWGSYWLAWVPKDVEARTSARALNHFIGHPEQRTLTIQIDHRAGYFTLGLLFALLGLALLAWGAQSLTASFQRDEARLTIRRRGAYGTRVRHVPFAAISDFHVTDWRGDSQLYARLLSGDRVRLSSSWDLQAMAGPRRVQALRQQHARMMHAFWSAAPDAAAQAPGEDD